jgi:hypothetical protein
MASFDSLVNGTQTLAIWTMTVTVRQATDRATESVRSAPVVAITDCVIAQAAGWNCRGRDWHSAAPASSGPR